MKLVPIDQHKLKQGELYLISPSSSSVLVVGKFVAYTDLFIKIKNVKVFRNDIDIFGFYSPGRTSSYSYNHNTFFKLNEN